MGASPTPHDSLPADGPLLYLDAGGTVVHVGLWQDGAWRAAFTSEEPAQEALFAGVRNVLAETGWRLEDLAGFALAAPPGSILGLRTALMAVNTWRTLPTMTATPAYRAGRLHLAAAALRGQGQAGPFAVLAPRRQGVWDVLVSEAAQPPGEVEEIESQALDELPAARFLLPQRKAWGEEPADCTTLDTSTLPEPGLLSTPGLFTRWTEKPLVLPASSAYVKWSGQRHRAV